MTVIFLGSHFHGAASKAYEDDYGYDKMIYHFNFAPRYSAVPNYSAHLMCFKNTMNKGFGLFTVANDIYYEGANIGEMFKSACYYFKNQYFFNIKLEFEITNTGICSVELKKGDFKEEIVSSRQQYSDIYNRTRGETHNDLLARLLLQDEDYARIPMIFYSLEEIQKLLVVNNNVRD